MKLEVFNFSHPVGLDFRKLCVCVCVCVLKIANWWDYTEYSSWTYFYTQKYFYKKVIFW